MHVHVLCGPALGRAEVDSTKLEEAKAILEEHHVCSCAQCWSCNAMFGTADHDGLCFSCHKTHTALPAEERPPAPAPTPGTAAPVVSPHMLHANRCYIATGTPVDLDATVRQAMATTHGIDARFGAASKVHELPAWELLRSAKTE